MDNKGIKITNHGETSVFVAISDGDKKTRVSAKSLEVKPGQTITAGAAKGGMNDSNSSVLAQAGVRAEPAAKQVTVPRATLLMIYEAMNYMGDILNNMDACEEEDEEATTPAFDAIRELLDDSFDAPTIPAQVPAAEVRAQALEEAAKMCEDQKFSDGDTRAKSVCKGCAAAIRSLAQSSTADKAGEVRADPINNAYVSKLQTHALCLLDAATVYAFAYMQDEAEDEDDCVCGEEQHERAKAVFAAIKSLSRVLDAAPSTADSGNTDEKGPDRG